MLSLTYNMLARSALASVTGQLFSKNLFTSFGKSQLPALASAVTYTALSQLGEKATGADKNPAGKRTTRNTWTRLFVQLSTAAAITYITPKLTQKLFDTKININQSGHLAASSLMIHLIPGMIAAYNGRR
ncbi:hypothetical protein [Candidatus Neptunichlamydia sp. REUL1]|uniref:hypothetical protein n=1 Tax=Candidatus Neptunichlamydia sp. REUL1 TaxID=3064277 RepID=UPI002930455A|nr:hypothetical protein [Candidatus Neptunochlamydia sp. REUL1]